MSYLRKIRRMMRDEMKPGELRHVTVIHEDHCPRLRGGSCRCNPEMREGMPPQISKQAKQAGNN